jgi:hypothetical protein
MIDAELCLHNCVCLLSMAACVNQWNLASCEGRHLHSHCSEVTTIVN